jgi:DNA (cytosine-5)-methyltransferase 1
MLRVIREVQPRWVVGENVLGLVNWNGGLVFDEVQADLEAEGYEVQPFILPAASVNAPHKRDRVWFVAYSKSAGNRKLKTANKGKQNRFNNNNGKTGPTPDTDHNGYATTKNGQGLGEGNDRNKTGQNDAIEFEGRAVSDGVAENTLRSGRIQREPEQEGAEIWEQRNACSGDSIGVCGEKVAGVASDTDSLRHTSCGEGTEAQGIGCGNNGEQKERSEQTEWTNGLLGLQPNAPDTDSANNKAQPQKRILGEEDEGRKTGRFEYGNTRTMWDKFPTTEPTIRTGNDGIPTELDSITFSKWRNESIKAAGNAIVPQVVFQIFKAINEYREKYP